VPIEEKRGVATHASFLRLCLKTAGCGRRASPPGIGYGRSPLPERAYRVHAASAFGGLNKGPFVHSAMSTFDCPDRKYNTPELTRPRGRIGEKCSPPLTCGMVPERERHRSPAKASASPLTTVLSGSRDHRLCVTAMYASVCIPRRLIVSISSL